MSEVRITLRLPEELHALLVTLADKEERSLNAQIVYLLRRTAFPPEAAK